MPLENFLSFAVAILIINLKFIIKNQLHIKLIRELESKPEQSQRLLSGRCGVSLGSIHYCLNALIKKGYVKVQNFRNAQNKMVYAYILTPSGLNHKKELTINFLKNKRSEYISLQKEIELLEEEIRFSREPIL
jgi:MarR family transcriptional regulator, temperature-dependent positive regulator of motility